MPAFTSLYSENLTKLITIPVTVQLRRTEDDPLALDSLQLTTLETDLYITIHLNNQEDGRVYQFSYDTIKSDGKHTSEAYCYLCQSMEDIGYILEAWFKSDKKNETHFLCSSCLDDLLLCRNYVLNQISHTKKIANVI